MGYLHLDGADFKIPVTLDLVKSGKLDEERADLTAYLKLSFGGFDSHEYITQYYHIDDFDWNEFNLVLDANAPGNGPDISLYDMQANEDHSKLSGKFRSFRSQSLNGGEIELLEVENMQDFEKVMKLMPKYDIQPMISGLYEINGKDVNLISIETIRSGSWNKSASNPFSGYTVNVRQLHRSLDNNVFKTVTKNLFSNYTYNFYRAAISLSLPIVQTVDCKLTTYGLDCGYGLTARRVTKQRLYSEILRPSETPRRLKNHTTFSNELEKGTEKKIVNEGDLDGRYYGYFYVPTFERIKRVSFDFINTSQQKGGRLLSAITRVHYDDVEKDTLPYKFETTEPANGCQSLILNEDSGEISLVLRKWNRNKIEGY